MNAHVPADTGPACTDIVTCRLPDASPSLKLMASAAMEAGSVFAASPIPQLVLDERHRVFQANRAWIVRLGADPAGQPWIGLVHPDDAAGEIPFISRLQSDRIGYCIQIRLARAEAAWLNVAIEVTPLGDGALVTVLPADSAAIQIVPDLPVIERRLLVAALSHDVFQHARLVIVHLQLLERAALDGAQRRQLDTASDHIKRLAGTLTGLTHWLRLADQPMAQLPCDLAAIVRSAAVACGCPGIETGELPTVHGDPSLLAELFTALIDNAIGYAGGPVRITSQCHDGIWSIELTDHGPGIPPAERLRVLEPMRRLHTWEERPGHGLGLAVAARIAARHGGALSIDGGSDVGCVVRVCLPS